MNCKVEKTKNANEVKLEITIEAEKFDNLFKEYFPSLLEPECAFESLNAYDEILMRKCSTNIFNVGDCPTVNFENISPVINRRNFDG